MGIATTSQRTARSVQYTDLPIPFLLHPNKKDIVSLKDSDAVKQAVKNLILTNFNERPFQPEIGGNVTEYLFENADSTTELEIRQNVIEVLENYEPRISTLDVGVELKPDNNAIIVTVTFALVGQSESVDVSVRIHRIK